MRLSSSRSPERKPLFALALSFFFTGLGQVYNGKPRRGILFFLASFLLPLLLFQLCVVGPGRLLVFSLGLSLLASLGIYIWAAVDAWKQAKRIGTNYRLKAYNKLVIYILLIVVWNLFSFGGFVDLDGILFWAVPYRMPTASMAPTILPGDLIISDKRIDHSKENSGLKRGELVVFKYPQDKSKHFVKRVIGLPGDKIEMNGKELYVNGKKWTGNEVPQRVRGAYEKIETGITHHYEEGDTGTYMVRFIEETSRKDVDVSVPEGSCFVLGDNRDNSADSRHWGCVPLTDILSRARQVYFSKEPRGKIRWGRIGKTLQTKRARGDRALE